MERTQQGSLVLITLLIATCCCSCTTAVDLSLPQDAANIKDFKELSAQYLPAGYQQPNITLADLQRVLEQKCRKASSEEEAAKLSNNIQQAATDLAQCVTGLVNITQVLDEVEKARPRGDLDVVFETYCLRLPNVTNCMKDFNNALLPCLSREERAHNAVLEQIISKLLEFVCKKNGDHIALFIAEEGPECLEQHKDNVGSCLQKTFGHYMPASLNVSQLEIPDLVLGPKQCVELHEFEGCVVRHLESCDNTTPSNIVESMFRYVRKASTCQEAINRVTRAGGQDTTGAMRAGAASLSALSSWTAAAALAGTSLMLSLIRA